MNIDHLFVHEDEPEVEPKGVDFCAFGGAGELGAHSQEHDLKIILLDGEPDYFATHGTDFDEKYIFDMCTDTSDGSPLEPSGLSPLRKNGPGKRVSVGSSDAVSSGYAKPKPALR